MNLAAGGLAGRTVAAALSGAWRENPPVLRLSVPQLEEITPLLLESGAGALAWRRIRNSPFAATRPAAELLQAYRLHAVQAALHENNIKQVFALLRATGVEPILVKGWAIARLYPESGLRPYGDIDLCVNAADYEAARNALRNSGDRFPVDLHKETVLLDDREWEEIFGRSQLIPLEDTTVRVLAAEDHLRVLCFHLLRHGIERPIGLCDIAVALEARPDSFSWDVCLGKNRRHADWIACVIGLARQLLNANVGEIPFSIKENQPVWLTKAVLKTWGQAFSNHFSQRPSINFYLHHPRGLARALIARWPTPIMGTFGVGGSFNALPRLPYQLGYLLLRSGRFVKQMAAGDAQSGRGVCPR